MIENPANSVRLFHVSEDPSLETFAPRPSPSYHKNIHDDVVFAITEELLHNYLVPRDCPRVTFYSKHDTLQHDKERFMGKNTSGYVVAVESRWREIIQRATLYCYEFPSDNFVMLDKGAGYYISYKAVEPISVHPIYNIPDELNKRGVELRVVPTLLPLAQEISTSTLQFSLIRMRNAIAETN